MEQMSNAVAITLGLVVWRCGWLISNPNLKTKNLAQINIDANADRNRSSLKKLRYVYKIDHLTVSNSFGTPRIGPWIRKCSIPRCSSVGSWPSPSSLPANRSRPRAALRLRNRAGVARSRQDPHTLNKNRTHCRYTLTVTCPRSQRKGPYISLIFI